MVPWMQIGGYTAVVLGMIMIAFPEVFSSALGIVVLLAGLSTLGVKGLTGAGG